MPKPSCLRKARQPAHKTPNRSIRPAFEAQPRSTTRLQFERSPSFKSCLAKQDLWGPSTHTLRGAPATTSRRKVIHPPGRPQRQKGRNRPAKPQNRRIHTKQLNTHKIMIRPATLQAARADNTAMHLQCHCVVCEVCRHAASLQVLC